MRPKNLLKLIGLGLLVWILSFIDLRRLFWAMLSLNPIWLACYAANFVALMLLRVTRLRLCLGRLGYSQSLGQTYAATLEPVLPGIVTPGKVGEFIRVSYLRNSGVSLIDAITLCLLERLVDFGTYLMMGLAGCAYIFGAPAHRGWLTAGLLFLLPAAHLLLFTLLCCGRHAETLIRLFIRLIPERYLPQSLASFSAVQAVIRRTLGIHQLFSLSAIALCILQINFLTEAFRLAGNKLVILFAYYAATLVSLLPISFAGLGTRDAAYISILGREGILPEKALLFSLLDGIALPLLLTLLMVLPMWLYKGLRHCADVTRGRRG